MPIPLTFINDYPIPRAPVLERHRRAVLHAQGYDDAWLEERTQHLAYKWLTGSASPSHAGSLSDRMAQAIADAEAYGHAVGSGDREVHAEGLKRILSRIDRAIADELGEPEPRCTLPSERPLPFPSGLLGAVNNVCSFHDACDVPGLESPGWPGLVRSQLRRSLCDEEKVETDEAWTELELYLGASDGGAHVPHLLPTDPKVRALLAKLADGCIDQIYVIVGTLLEFGIPADRVWAEVQRANMAKVGADGKVERRPDGKILKPEGWTPPDIERVLFGTPEAKP